MKISKTIIASAIVSSVIFSGCATMFGGGAMQTISIKSDKPTKGILVYSDKSGMQDFTTPATLTVERKSKDINITSPTKQFEQVNLEKKTNPWVFGDVLATSPLSTTVDAITGAMWKYDENVTLKSN